MRLTPGGSVSTFSAVPEPIRSAETRVGIAQEVADGRLIFMRLRDPKISPSRLMLLSRSPTDMSAAATAFGTLLAQGIDDLQH